MILIAFVKRTMLDFFEILSSSRGKYDHCINIYTNRLEQEQTLHFLVEK